MIEQLNESIEAGKAAYVFKAIQPTFGWDTAVGYLQYCADAEFGEVIGTLNYRLPLADEIDSIKPVKEYLSENLTREILGTDLYVTLCTTSGNQKYHSKNDTLLWNVVGQTKFGVQEDNFRPMELGDLIFIPKNTEYIVKPETARAFVLFSLQ